MLTLSLLIIFALCLALVLFDLFSLRRYLRSSKSYFYFTPLVAEIYNLCRFHERFLKDSPHRLRFKSDSEIHPKALEYYIKHVINITHAKCVSLLSLESTVIFPHEYRDALEAAREAFSPWIKSGATTVRKREETFETVSFALLHRQGINTVLTEHIVFSSGERWVLVCGFEHVHELTYEKEHDVDLISKQCEEDLDVLSHVFQLTERLDELSLTMKRRDSDLQYISHDIRSPLHNLSLLLNTIKDEVDDKDIIAAGIRSLSSAQKVVDELLVDESKKHEEICELSLLFKDLHSEYLQAAQQKGISFNIPALSTPTNVVFNPHDLRRVLQNFISNAIQYTFSGFVKVTYSQQSPEQGVIEISDSGVGMSEDECRRFGVSEGRFRKELSSGYGIGAVGAFRLIEQNKSKIMVSSVEGKGTALYITLSSC